MWKQEDQDNCKSKGMQSLQKYLDRKAWRKNIKERESSILENVNSQSGALENNLI